MREIKFRAWDTTRKLFIYVPDIKDLLFGYGNNYDYTNGDDVEILQYTGLKDKKGVEIYEGDILFEEEKSIRSQMPPRRHSIVVFKSNGWKRDAYNGSMNVFPDLAVRGLEVIGNIYENPELLN